jgi:hypothetical protein
MSKLYPIIGKVSTLNTILDPFQEKERLSDSGQPLPQYLTKAVNVRISDSTTIERADPTTHLFDLTAGHSLFCDQSDCLVHDSGSIYRVETSLTLSTALRTGMSGQRVGHTRYGKAIYFGNRQERGVYAAGICEAWAIDSYKGVITSRQFAAYAPIFDHLAAYNGMILFSYDNHLFATEPGKPGLWETVPVWSTDTRIIMIKPVVTDTFPVSGGVFVSDEKRLTYLGGLNPWDFAEPRTTNYPALEWSVSHELLDGSLFGEKPGLCAVFSTSKGLCLAYPDGQLINATQNKIKLPAGLSIGATLIDGHNIISTMR